jgi:hypothetical protein
MRTRCIDDFCSSLTNANELKSTFLGRRKLKRWMISGIAAAASANNMSGLRNDMNQIALFNMQTAPRERGRRTGSAEELGRHATERAEGLFRIGARAGSPPRAASSLTPRRIKWIEIDEYVPVYSPYDPESREA